MRKLLVVLAGLLLVSCGPTPTPKVIRETVEVTKLVQERVAETKEVTREVAVLITQPPLPTHTPVPTYTPQVTHTPKPTVTPKPTATPKPTVTPKPTATPKPPPTPTFTAQEWKAQTTIYVSYDSLARNTEQYVGRLVYYRGKVIQVMEVRDLRVVLRVNVTKGTYGFWNDTIWVNYEGPRVLEDDIVDIWGKVVGRRTYKTILGASITIPEITAVALEFVGKAD